MGDRPLTTILYLHHVGHFAGAENSLLHLVSRLDRSSFRPVFLCPGTGEFPDRLRSHGIRVIPHHYSGFRNLSGLAGTVTRILRICRSERVGLLHSNGPQTNLPAGIAGRLSGTPVVWHARNLLESGMIDIDRRTALLPNRILCNSDAIRLRFIGPAAGTKAITIINGVDIKDYDLTISAADVRADLGIPAETQVVGMTSRLGADKGHATLLDAVAQLAGRFPRLWVLLVGDHVFDEDAGVPEALKAQAERLGIAERVIFTGFRRDVPRLYAAMDVFVLASDAEPCGRVIFEAMAMAKPVVGTRSGGTPEIVADGQTGLLFSSGNAHELADLLERLLGSSELLDAMGRAGRRRVEESFTIERYVARTVEEYRTLLESQSAEKVPPATP